LVLSVQEVRAQQFIRLEGKDLATVLDLGFTAVEVTLARAAP
jgi:hypothetical protein